MKYALLFSTIQPYPESSRLSGFFLLHFSSLYNHDKDECFRNESKNTRRKTQQHMDPKQLSWIRITKNPSNSIFENIRNKNIKLLMSNKRIYVENLVLLTFKSILRILFNFFFIALSYLFFSIVLSKVYCSSMTLIHWMFKELYHFIKHF